MHDFKRFPELTNKQMQIYYFESPHKQITEDFFCKCIRVIDGDTIMVRWKERDFDFPIRFIDTAAPEMNEGGGKEAKSFLEKMIEGEEIEVRIDYKNRIEKWGRLLGLVFHNGINVNQMTINNGHAVTWQQRNVGKFVELKETE